MRDLRRRRGLSKPSSAVRTRRPTPQPGRRARQPGEHRGKERHVRQRDEPAEHILERSERGEVPGVAALRGSVPVRSPPVRVVLERHHLGARRLELRLHGGGGEVGRELLGQAFDLGGVSEARASRAQRRGSRRTKKRRPGARASSFSPQRSSTARVKASAEPARPASGLAARTRISRRPTRCLLMDCAEPRREPGRRAPPPRARRPRAACAGP